MFVESFLGCETFFFFFFLLSNLSRLFSMSHILLCRLISMSDAFEHVHKENGPSCPTRADASSSLANRTNRELYALNSTVTSLLQRKSQLLHSNSSLKRTLLLLLVWLLHLNSFAVLSRG